VRTIAFQLVDEGVLDPTATVGQWVPMYPNADRVTVQMLLDDTSGWGDYGPIEPDPVTADFGRAWSLREAVDGRAATMTTLAEPGTVSDDAGTNEMVLGLIAQEIAGQPLIELVRERVSEPAGLHDTGLLDGSNTPDGFRSGVFSFNGASMDTAAFDGTSYVTWNLATHSAVSTPTDLLDLLDAWTTGELFTTNRTPAPDRYALHPADHPSLEYHVGRGVPFNGFCPCTAVDGGIEPSAIGRTPGSIGTTTILLRYADDISVVFNVNSNEAAVAADLKAVADEIHDLAAAR
jgi:CubicO group peptidase (beta-lactamase class C family)